MPGLPFLASALMTGEKICQATKQKRRGANNLPLFVYLQMVHAHACCMCMCVCVVCDEEGGRLAFAP